MSSFPHHKLDAFVPALALAKAVHEFCHKIPRGHRNLAEQLTRSSTAVVLNLSEGANRYGCKEKAHRYSIARGECGETAAGIELAMVLGLVDEQAANQALELAATTGRMLTGLIKSQQK